MTNKMLLNALSSVEQVLMEFEAYEAIPQVDRQKARRARNDLHNAIKHLRYSDLDLKRRKAEVRDTADKSGRNAGDPKAETTS